MIRTYAVKVGGDAKPVAVLCESIVLRDGHATFYGCRNDDPEAPEEQRVALTRGWYIHEVHAPEAKLITPRVVLTDAPEPVDQPKPILM